MTEQRTSLIARVALVVVAVVVIGWLAVGLRSAVPETHAKRLLAHQPVTRRRPRSTRAVCCATPAR